MHGIINTIIKVLCIRIWFYFNVSYFSNRQTTIQATDDGYEEFQGAYINIAVVKEQNNYLLSYFYIKMVISMISFA